MTNSFKFKVSLECKKRFLRSKMASEHTYTVEQCVFQVSIEVFAVQKSQIADLEHRVVTIEHVGLVSSVDKHEVSGAISFPRNHVAMSV